jgi:hypothetical protein
VLHDIPGGGLVRAEACLNHATPADIAARAAIEVERQAAEERWRNTAPACWSWPVPENVADWQPAPDPTAALLAAAGLAIPTGTPEDAAESRGVALLSWWQQGRCAICGRPDNYLVDDHDHATGMIRGYLCTSCNTREGVTKGETVGPFARYRDRPPTAILGIRLRYWDAFRSEYARPELPAARRDLWEDAVTDGIGL